MINRCDQCREKAFCEYFLDGSYCSRQLQEIIISEGVEQAFGLALQQATQDALGPLGDAKIPKFIREMIK